MTQLILSWYSHCSVCVYESTVKTSSTTTKQTCFTALRTVALFCKLFMVFRNIILIKCWSNNEENMLYSWTSSTVAIKGSNFSTNTTSPSCGLNKLVSVWHKIFSTNKSNETYSINLLSGLCLVLPKYGENVCLSSCTS